MMLMLRNVVLALLCACSLTVYAADTPSPATSVPPAESLFIRDALVEKGLATGLDKDPELARLVEDFRKEQLARLALNAILTENMPDLNSRAEELYQVRKDKAYSLPLRLRVRVLEMDANGDKEAATVKKLEELREQIASGKLDFKIAVLQHSEAADRKLTEGDSQWFYKGQKPDVFYEAAELLTPEQPLSKVVVHRGSAWLLYLLERKAPEVRPLDEVKPEIIAELQREYRESQEKTLLDGLREQFRQKNASNTAPDPAAGTNR